MSHLSLSLPFRSAKHPFSIGPSFSALFRCIGSSWPTWRSKIVVLVPKYEDESIHFAILILLRIILKEGWTSVSFQKNNILFPYILCKTHLKFFLIIQIFYRRALIKCFAPIQPTLSPLILRWAQTRPDFTSFSVHTPISWKTNIYLTPKRNLNHVRNALFHICWLSY